MNSPVADRPNWPSPLGPLPAPPDERIRTIGIVALILAILETLYAAYQLFAALLSGPLLKWQKSLFAGMPGGDPAVFDSAEKLVGQITVGQSLRMVAFIAVSVWLIVIAVQLIKGRAAALEAARSWTWLALGALALSVLIQAFVLVPAQIASQQEMFRSLPTSSGPPPPAGFMEGMGIFTIVTTVVMVAVGAILMAIWPVALRLWAGKVLKQVSAAKAD